MFASDEHHLWALLFVTRTSGFPTRDSTNGQEVLQVLINRYSMTTHIANMSKESDFNVGGVRSTILN